MLSSAVLLAACGGEDAPPAAKATPTATASPTPTPTPTAAIGADCPAGLDGTARRRPPSYMGVLSYAHLYKSQGRRVFYAWLDGVAADVRSRRDDVQNELVQNWGFASLATAETGDAATAHLEGNRHAVDVQVAPLCEGKLRIRYTVR